MSRKQSTTQPTDTLELRYVPLAQASRWDDHPKKHDIGALIRSIELHGFGDPPKYDTRLDLTLLGVGLSFTDMLAL